MPPLALIGYYDSIRNNENLALILFILYFYKQQNSREKCAGLGLKIRYVF